jgi:hypothetical protein
MNRMTGATMAALWSMQYFNDSPTMLPALSAAGSRSCQRPLDTRCKRLVVSVEEAA